MLHCIDSIIELLHVATCWPVAMAVRHLEERLHHWCHDDGVFQCLYVWPSLGAF
jgi:hypothetical protein